MSQTKEGARKARATMIEKFGEDYWKTLGKAGGSVKTRKGFAMMTPEQRREAGRKGGAISRRKK